MVEKDVREGICHTIYQYVEANNKYMKNNNKNKESSYLKYWDVNSLYGWVNVTKVTCKEKLPGLKKHLNLMKIKSYIKL